MKNHSPNKKEINCVGCGRQMYERGNIKICPSCWNDFDILQLRIDVSEKKITFEAFHNSTNKQMAYMFHNRPDKPEEQKVNCPHCNCIKEGYDHGMTHCDCEPCVEARLNASSEEESSTDLQRYDKYGIEEDEYENRRLKSYWYYFNN